MEPRPYVYTVAEVAKLLKVNRSTLYEALESGQLPGQKLGAKWLIGSAALWKWANGKGGERWEKHSADEVRSPAPAR